MRKMLFVHDNRLVKDVNGNIYAGSCYNDKIWNRYLQYGDELTICMKMNPKPLTSEEAEEKYNIISMKNVHISVVDDITKCRSPKAIRSITKTIEEEVKKCNYLIARMPSVSIEGNIAIHYAKKYKKPYMVEVVACVFDSLWNHSLKGKILAVPSYLLAKKSIKSSPYTVYVTESYLQKRYPCKGKCFSLSDVEIKNGDAISDGKRIDLSRVIIGSAGAVNVKYKGQEAVIKALGILKGKGIDNIEYQIAGDGDQSWLRTIAKECNVLEQVVFKGSIPHNEIYQWLSQLTVYIQPSKNEGLPRALLEAMSCGLPCIGTDTGGIPELLPKEYLFRKSEGREMEIADFLEHMDISNLQIAGEKNYQKSQEYTEQILKEKRDKIYKEFLNEFNL